MTRRRARWLIPICLLALAAGAPSASAASTQHRLRRRAPRVFTLGSGEHDWLAVDSHGTAHVVWSSDSKSRPTVVHYCQVARGSSRCTHSHQLAPDVGPNESTDFAGPKVAMLKSGQVLVATSRCCGGLNLPYIGAARVYGYLSSDGGATFGAPALLGFNPPSGDLEVGPGQFSVSTITDTTTVGEFYQAMPVGQGAPPPTDVARLSDGAPQLAVYRGSVAFVDPTTPIAAFADLKSVYYRVWGGSGDVNSSSSWRPVRTLGAGVYPRLAGGPKGVFIGYGRGDLTEFRLVVARYDGTRFGAPVAVPGAAHARSFDLAQDASGDLEAAWVGNHHALYFSASVDGGRSWSPRAKLAGGPAKSFYDVHLRAAPDGSGLVVFDTASGPGRIRAVALPAIHKSHGKSCPTTLTFGVVAALARQGCFARHGRRYTIAGAIRVNGLDVDAPSGGGTITIEPGARRISSSGAALVHAGAVKLAKSKLDWVVPKGGGPLKDRAGNPVTLTPAKFGVRLLGLRVSGWVTPSLHHGGADLPVNLVVPPPVSGGAGGAQTSNVTLHTTGAVAAGAADDAGGAGGDDSSGLEISQNHFHLHLSDAFLGIVRLHPFDLDYTADPAVLKGAANLYLPVVPNAKIRTQFEFDNGEFADASADAQFKPALPIAGTVLLNDINFHTNASKGCVPAAIGGGASVSGGPQVAGVALIEVDGTINYSFPKASCNQPGVLDVDGVGKLVGVKVATLHVEYKTSGLFTLDADVALGSHDSLGIDASLDGAVDFGKDLFSAEGKAAVYVLGYKPASVDLLVSNVGMGACVQLSPIAVGPISVNAGFKYVWGHKFTPYLAGCDIDSLHPVGLPNPAASSSAARGRVGSAAAATGTVTVPRGVPSFAIVASGPGGPALTLTGPGGQRIETPAAPAMTAAGKGWEAFRVPGLNETSVTLEHPAAGRWTVAAAPGSAMTGLLKGRGLPKPKVSASVHRRHGRLRLTYRVRRIPGQTVRFAERGRDTFRVIGRARSARGTISFHPGAGRGGRRAIVALVGQRGFTRARLTVAHYRAPVWARPAKPRHVRARRRHGRLVVSWHRARGAARYAVRANLRDGRRIVRLTHHRRLRIAHVPGIDAGHIFVRGLRVDNVPGPAGRARLRAHPHHRRHGRRRGRRHQGGRRGGRGHAHGHRRRRGGRRDHRR